MVQDRGWQDAHKDGHLPGPLKLAGDQQRGAAPAEHLGAIRSIVCQNVGSSDAPKQPLAEALGRLLYLVHLAVLLWWLLDKSSSQRATAALVSVTQQLLPSAALTLRVPPVRRFVISVDGLVREALFALQSPPEGFMFLARRPSRETIDRFLLASQDLPLSYGPVGIVRPETARQGLDEATVAIGRGETDFERPRAALMAWKQFDIGWVERFPRHAPIAVGTVVAVLIRHLGFWSLNERVPNAHSGVTSCAPPVLPNRLDRLPDTPVSRRLAQSCASGVG